MTYSEEAECCHTTLAQDLMTFNVNVNNAVLHKQLEKQARSDT